MSTKTTQAMNKGIKTNAKKSTSTSAKTKRTAKLKEHSDAGGVAVKASVSKVRKMKTETKSRKNKAMTEHPKGTKDIKKKTETKKKVSGNAALTKPKKSSAELNKVKPTKVASAKALTQKSKSRSTAKKATSDKLVAIKVPSKKSTIKDNKVAKKTMSISTVEITKVGDASGAGFLGIPPYSEEPGEEYMNNRQAAHFRVLLERWKQALMEEVDRTMHHMKDEAANFPDLSDRASQEEEFNLELRARDRERKLIWKIDEALERIEQNDYGYCDACGVEIGIRRLEARPTATLCIDCKTLDEIREKQTRA
jgi:DnaK suppressor protein